MIQYQRFSAVLHRIPPERSYSKVRAPAQTGLVREALVIRERTRYLFNDWKDSQLLSRRPLILGTAVTLPVCIIDAPQLESRING